MFLILVLCAGEWSLSSSGCITTGERGPSNYCIGGGMGPKVGLDDVKGKFLNLLVLKLRPLGCLASVIPAPNIKTALLRIICKHFKNLF